MSDSKKPKLSEIRARVENTTITPPPPLDDIPYLLDLVDRMGKALDKYGDHLVGCNVIESDPCNCGLCEARALLEEIKP